MKMYLGTKIWTNCSHFKADNDKKKTNNQKWTCNMHHRKDIHIALHVSNELPSIYFIIWTWWSKQWQAHRQKNGEEKKIFSFCSLTFLCLNWFVIVIIVRICLTSKCSRFDPKSVRFPIRICLILFALHISLYSVFLFRLFVLLTFVFGVSGFAIMKCATCSSKNTFFRHDALLCKHLFTCYFFLALVFFPLNLPSSSFVLHCRQRFSFLFRIFCTAFYSEGRQWNCLFSDFFILFSLAISMFGLDGLFHCFYSFEMEK